MGAAMDQRAGPETTATGKQHFAVLDGLRGTAALLVVIFHVQGITVVFEGSKVLLHHAPLAVDQDQPGCRDGQRQPEQRR